jgi:hypothetical protein
VGARSISELVRLAIERLTAGPGSSPAVDIQMRTLKTKIEVLAEELERLSQMVEAPKREVS